MDLRRRRGVIWLLWACFLLRGAYYSSVIPLWEGFDEFAHYARVAYLSEYGREPDRQTPIPAQIQQSLERLPAHDIGVSFDEYWKGVRRPAQPATNYEAQQPPLFYWIAALVDRLAAWLGSPLGGRVLIVRLLCVLMASVAVPAAYGVASAILGPRAGAGAAALVAVLPLFTFTATHVANDGMAIGVGAALVWLIVAAPGRWLLTGLALAAALLTKAYFLAILPPIALLALQPRHRITILRALACAAVLCGWWFWDNWTTTGSLTGNLVLVRPGAAAGSMLQSLRTFPVWRSADFIWTSFLWIGNWSFLVARAWMYHLAALLVIAALAAVAWRLWKKREPELGFLAAVVAFFFAAVLYFGLASYSAGLGPGSHGWYACAVAMPFCVLLAAGLRRYVWIAAALLAILEAFASNIYMLPYYAGFISHNPSGGLPAVQLSQFGAGGWWLMFEHLSIEKPLGPASLISLWTLALAATLVAVTISARSGTSE